MPKQLLRALEEQELEIAAKAKRVTREKKTGASRWVCPYWIAHEGVATTVISVVNAEESSVDVKVLFYDGDGRLVPAQSRGATLGPRASFFMRTEDRGVTERQSGSFVVEANGKVLPHAYASDMAYYGPAGNRGGNAVHWQLTLYLDE